LAFAERQFGVLVNITAQKDKFFHCGITESIHIKAPVWNWVVWKKAKFFSGGS
jgi:hypothetical protein